MRAVVTLAVLCVAAGSAAAQDVRPFVKGSWAALRQSHQGKPLIVHFWGITCPPCLGELPRWSDLVAERRDVRVIFVAADPVVVDRRRVERTLADAGLGEAENWMFQGEFFDPLRYEVSPDWGGELPLTLLIDKAGTITTIAGVTDPTVVRKWLAAHAR
jgi:thiol-disulfide isomerase/thioredoxin